MNRKSDKILFAIVCSLLTLSWLFCEIGVTYENTTLSMIKKSPESFKNMGIKIKVIFNQITDNWVPVFTFFTSDKYVNFSTWGYEQNIWFEKTLLNDHPYFYINKDSKYTEKIIKAKRYECFEFKGIVRNIYKGVAWIEVEEVKNGVSPCISEEVLSLAIKANESFKEDDFLEVIYYAEKLKKYVLLPELSKRITEIKCLSYLKLDLRKEALDCYTKLLSESGDEKYKVIIDGLKVEIKSHKKGKQTLFIMKKLQILVREKNLEIKDLKSEINELKKQIANIKIGIANTVANSEKNNRMETVSIVPKPLCNTSHFSRRTVERRLDRDEVNALLNMNKNCDSTFPNNLTVVKEIQSNLSKSLIPVKNEIKEGEKSQKTRISRRTIERRLDKEEFEYLIKKASG